MPTPDPSLIPAAITTLSGIFTSNYSTVLLAVLALVGIITIPVLIIRGGLRWAVGGVRSLFRRA